MNWLTALLKHLAISRSITGAIFVTAVVAYMGPRLFPAYVDPVPKEWSPAVVGALVFTGTLLLFWGISAGWKAAVRSAGKASKALASSALSPQEAEVLLAMAAKPSTSLNLEEVNCDQAPFSHLELIELMQTLAKRGMVRLNQFNENLVALTPEGRQRALELLRASEQ